MDDSGDMSDQEQVSDDDSVSSDIEDLDEIIDADVGAHLSKPSPQDVPIDSILNREYGEEIPRPILPEIS